jgi:D-3-phosphoglycerate dehydrogenase
MRGTVLLPEKVADEGIDLLKKLDYEVRFGRGLDKETLIEDLQGCIAVIIRVARIDEEVFERCPDLKVVAKHGAGYDSIDITAARKLGRRVVFAPTANSLSVAEHTMALILACAKKLNLMGSEYSRGNYQIKDKVLANEISGKVLGLIGLGRIGNMVARMAHFGFGMNVIAFDPYLPKNKKIEGVTIVESREELLKTSDFISIHIPVTNETKKSIGADELKMMKKSAYLINVARGNVVDEKALIESLQKGDIAGAGLDVTDPEPATADNPLFRLKNVIITPHCAAASEEAMARMVTDSVRGIDDVLNGRIPEFPVV